MAAILKSTSFHLVDQEEFDYWNYSCSTRPGEKVMRILTYKRTHTGDPDALGRFGIHDCMGVIRSLSFDAVIGVGGVGAEPQRFGIDRKLNWIGVGPRRSFYEGRRAELIEFDYFLLLEERGPYLHLVAPGLAEHIYEGRVRYLFNAYAEGEQVEAEALVEWCRRTSSKQLT